MVDINELELRMESSFEALKREFSGLRTGRASASLLDPVIVDAYGSNVPLKQVANVSVPESRMLSVQVWDKTMVKAVEKAITNAGLGLNPIGEGQIIRINLPDLTEERRRELVKLAGKYAENSKISIRNIRRDGMDEAKKSEKNGDISEDEMHNIGDNIQKLTDKFVNKIDEILTIKEKDIMTL